MPGHDRLLFLPLPFAHAARGNGAGPSTANGAAPHVDPARDAGDAGEPPWARAALSPAAWWQRLANERGRALARIAELGDIAAGGLTPGDGLNARLIPGTDPARVSVVADAWNAMRMAMVDAGLQVMLDTDGIDRPCNTATPKEA